MITKKKVTELIDERIAELDNGLFVVSLKITTNNIIHVEIDKHDGNVAIVDCMSVSRNVEHNLDREEQDFELHVSSAGLDKPLRVLPQFIKNIGRNVTVKLNNKTVEEGEMIQADKEGLTIRQEKRVKIEGKKKKQDIVEEKYFPMSEIKETKIVISFK
ncbi:ribosome assembly cofactor RimP [Crocinitomicaceae bacterium]|jgi:ribosome maturation factor RimP|nr:ribosome assembly cofactor RimP [Crocinitomicaceae bacterium]